MRPTSTRLLRRGLLAVLVVVAGAVAWSLRRPAPAQLPEPGATAGAPAQGMTVVDGAILRFREGKQRVEIRFRAMAGQEGGAAHLQGVTVTFPYVAEGREATATITADECLYEAARQRAAFRGRVHVVTSDGFELETESLDYLGDEGVARSQEDVRFRRHTMSGSGRGMEYRSAAQSVSLQSNVRLRFEEEAGPPTDIEAGAATASRSEELVRFGGGVTVRQGLRELHSKRLQLKMAWGLTVVEKAAAIEDVDLRAVGAEALPGTVGTGGGGKRLRCRRLNVGFRARGVMSEATANNPATLEILPGPKDPRERRRIETRSIRFGFDEQGRLTTLQGLAAEGPPAEPRQRVTVLTSDPVPPSRGGQRRVECGSFTANLDPESGALRSAEFVPGFWATVVVFSEPGRKAWAQQASYEEGTGLLTLVGEPRIRDEEQGSDLRGQRIEVGTRTQNVSASGNVRHTLTRRGRAARPGMLGGEEPTTLLCRFFDYDAATKTAHYRENALLRSGRDEIRAPLIVLKEPTPERRSLAASGGVASRLHPRREKGAAREPAPVDARSRELLYEEWTNRVVYTGDVEIRQGDILTKSPEAVVTLTADGQTVDHMVAGEPVEVQQGLRRATGRQGTYTPQNETFVLVGDKVVLKDLDRRVEGRVLIFQVGNDRIRVDGREEVRTEAVFKKKEPPRP
jgi:lipopolysaccharide transport protein LptA/LPS export ABC transporter protein LptC